MLEGGEGGPSKCELAYICVCRKRADGVDIQGVLDWELECQGSLCQVSTVILELNLLESQFSQLQNGDARISFTGLLRRSKQMHVSSLQGIQQEGCSGGGVWGGALLLPLDACWSWVSSSTQFG